MLSISFCVLYFFSCTYGMVGMEPRGAIHQAVPEESFTVPPQRIPSQAAGRGVFHRAARLT